MEILLPEVENIKPAIPPTHAELLSAIRLKCENCYGALSIANALGGTQSNSWILCHSYGLKELIEEAKKRNLDLGSVRTQIDPKDTPVTETLYFKRATGTLSEEEFRKEFSKWQRGEK